VKKIGVLLLCGLFLFGCASSSGNGGVKKKDDGAALEEAKASADAAVKKVHDLQAEKAKLEAEKGGAAQEQPAK
jgi:hypothetical protein